jgi:hypothetical protein
MTTEKQIAANRANARGSTGPRSRSGKEKISRNATRHGATVKPDPAHVGTWVRVITGNPALDAGSLLADNEALLPALNLADAEARLAGAEAALDDFERDPTVQEMQAKLTKMASAALAHFRVRLDPSGSTPVRDAVMPTSDEAYALLAQARAIEKQRRLFQRYVREARGQRKRAFTAWVANLAALSEHHKVGSWPDQQRE